MKLVTTTQMRALEVAAVAAGATWPGLMRQAGTAVAQRVAELGAAGDRLVILVGPGNNGGDALVAARWLHAAGRRVMLIAMRQERDGDWPLAECRAAGLVPLDGATLGDDALRALLADADVIIDGLLGSGTSRPLAGILARLVALVNQSGRPVISIDVPSGLHADTGTAPGGAVRATRTIATGPIKRGCLFARGPALCGALETIALPIPPAALELVMSERLDAALARRLLPARPDDSYKGTFGTALVVAGSPAYPGAAGLASAAAARAGAGLVALATTRSTPAVGRIPEIILRSLPDAEWGALGPAAADEVLALAQAAQAVLVGPGIGRDAPTVGFIQRLFGLDGARPRGSIGFRPGGSAEATAAGGGTLPPLVVDADALSVLGGLERDVRDGGPHWWQRSAPGQIVITPHPGEMCRLLGCATLPDDRVALAADAAQRWSQVVVLKDATTVIASPDGRTVVHAGANAALATAGTGDVLAGLITGLICQGLAPADAAVLGVYLHGAAGRLVRDEVGEMGALASDLLPRLPTAARRLRHGEGG
jgi:hydroxyethylthiazole kinase-like uncharacterized protein yjeF